MWTCPGVGGLVLVGKMSGEVKKCILTATLGITAEKAFLMRGVVYRKMPKSSSD